MFLIEANTNNFLKDKTTHFYHQEVTTINVDVSLLMCSIFVLFYKNESVPFCNLLTLFMHLISFLKYTSILMTESSIFLKNLD